jgi:hypothetical protein
MLILTSSEIIVNVGLRFFSLHASNVCCLQQSFFFACICRFCTISQVIFYGFVTIAPDLCDNSDWCACSRLPKRQRMIVRRYSRRMHADIRGKDEHELEDI